MKIHRFDQYSDEWWAVRSGIPTASCASKILTPTGKLSATSEAYMNELMAARWGFGDEPMEPTEWMQRGTELEPEARKAFSFMTDLVVTEVGFVTNDEGTAGCSPDGLIWPASEDTMIAEPVPYERGLEIKCPKASTHIGYLRANELPAYYKPQVHFSMAVTGLDRWYFMSYFPGLDPLIVLVERDEYTEKVSAAIKEFTERLAIESARFGINTEKAA